MASPLPRLVRGAGAGALGGLAGSLAMTAFLAALHRILRRSRRVQHPQHSLLRGTRAGEWMSQRPPGRDDATVRLVSRLAQRVIGRRLTRQERRAASPLAHYLFGTVAGAAYGAATAVAPSAARGAGLAYGTIVWLLADEVGIPALGLSPPPWRSPWPVHAWAFVSHLIFGGVTESVRRRLQPPGR